VTFVEGRSNVMVEYPGTGDGVVSLVGCHLDVVTANPDSWTFDPFTLTRDGDKLRVGRGVVVRVRMWWSRGRGSWVRGLGGGLSASAWWWVSHVP